MALQQAPAPRGVCAFALLAFLACSAAPAAAMRFSLSNLFGSGMILQRDAPNRIWGWAPPGQPIFVTLIPEPLLPNSTTFAVSTTTDQSGLWVQEMPVRPSSGAYIMYVSTAPHNWPQYGTYFEYNGIYYGDVILCSGQSNMQIVMQSFMHVPAAVAPFDYNGEIQAANEFTGKVSLFLASAATGATEPLEEFMQPYYEWVPASNTTVATFSAACWFMGATLAKALGNVKIGLIDSSWGGTHINSWSPPEAVDSCPPHPNLNLSQCDNPCNYSSLYNSMIAPLTVGPLAVKTIVWWQGESDDTWTSYYACALGALIDSWRARFGVPDLFWLTAQLSTWNGGAVLPAFRDMQAKVTATRQNTATTVLIDLGDSGSPEGNVHSRRKHEQGARLAQSLLHYLYGQTDVQASGPTYANASASAVGADGTAVVKVTFGAGGLGTKGTLVPVPFPGRPSPTSNSSRCPSESFSVSQCDWYDLLVAYPNGTQSWLNASTTINGATLLLMASGLPANSNVIGTRYGWAAWPVVTITNSDGNPMVPWQVNFTSSGAESE